MGNGTRLLVFLAGLVGIFWGVDFAWDRIRNPEPLRMTCADYLSNPPPDYWVNLSDCAVDYREAIVVLNPDPSGDNRKDELTHIFVPVRASADTGESTRVIMQAGPEIREHLKHLIAANSASAAPSSTIQDAARTAGLSPRASRIAAAEINAISLLAKGDMPLRQSPITINGVTFRSPSGDTYGSVVARAPASWKLPQDWILVESEIAPSWGLSLVPLLIGISLLVFAGRGYLPDKVQ